MYNILTLITYFWQFAHTKHTRINCIWMHFFPYIPQEFPIQPVVSWGCTLVVYYSLWNAMDTFWCRASFLGYEVTHQPSTIKSLVKDPSIHDISRRRCWSCDTLHTGWPVYQLPSNIHSQTRKKTGHFFLSNEETPSCWGFFLGMASYPNIWGIFHKTHES